MYIGFVKVRSLICVLYFIFGSLFAKQNILVIAIPKTGCHLLTKCISLLTSKQEIFAYARLTEANILEYLQQADNLYPEDSGYFVLGHVEWSKHCQELILEQKPVTFFILRHPGDQVVSHAHFLLKSRFSDTMMPLTLLDFNLDAVILSLIQSNDLYTWVSRSVHDIESLYRLYLPWQHCPHVYTTYFEKLVGSRGGGNDEEQLNEIKNISKHLGLVISDAEVQNVANKLFGDDDYDWSGGRKGLFIVGEKTFRCGQIGSWKTCFNEQHKKAFIDVAGKLLNELGYDNF